MRSPVSISPEEPVGGRYELAERVGEGNFAVTYRARDLVLGRTVAVKMLRAQYAADPTFVARFEREARVAASVSHPNVVDVYDFGAYRDTFYIVMQFVPGRTLKEELAARGPLPAKDAVRIAVQILDGLAAIHAAGIVHRDIKPQNVLLGPDRVARVTDFGVAHYPVQGALTTHGTTVGTASYMAPEQARGAALGEATDLYAVGVVLFELLSGRLPFGGENPMAVMLAHLQQPPPPLGAIVPEADLPSALEAEVMRALAKDPTERWPSATEMAGALAASLAASPRETIAAGAGARTGTVQVPFVAPAEPAGGTRAMTAVGSWSRPEPPPAAGAQRLGGPILPPAGVRRRPAAWLAPAVLFSLALAALGGLVASGAGLPGFGGDEGEPTSVAVALADATETPAASPPASRGSDLPPASTRPPLQTIAVRTPAPTSAPRSAPIVRPTATVVPQPTGTPAPTSTSTATVTPEPTSTPLPTATPTATPSPTAQPTEAPPPEPTAMPTPAVIDAGLDPSGVVGGPVPGGPPTMAPPPEPIATEAIEPEPTPVPVEPEGSAFGFLDGSGIIRFEPRQWRDATDIDSDAYRREAVAIYGTESASPRATLPFELNRAPTERMDFYVEGLGDETGRPFPFTVQINDFVFDQIPQAFPNWKPGVDGTRGELAAWGGLRINIPAGALRAGKNEISVISLQPGADVGVPPYILLGEAALVPSDSDVDPSAAMPITSVRLTNVRPSDQGDAKPEAAPDRKPIANEGKNDRSNGNRGRGNGGGDGGGEDNG